MQRGSTWHEFKHVEGKNGTTTFLSNHNRRGGPTHAKVKHDTVLTPTQANLVNKKISIGNGVILTKKSLM